VKVTPLNILKYWRRLMFPPRTRQYYMDRLMMKSDLPWEPWLHCGVWIATVLAIVIGDAGVIPPIRGVDWVWVIFGLVSPIVGFFSVWKIEYGRGRTRYIAIWSRTAADLGLCVSILTYLAARWSAGQLGISGVLSDVILFLSAWFTFTLVYRDVRFLAATEKLAAKLRASNNAAYDALIELSTDERR